MAIGGLEIVVVLLVAVLLFGSGKFSTLLGDRIRGLTTTRKSMNEPGAASAAGNSSTEQPHRTAVRRNNPTREHPEGRGPF